jgi:hypothetical protein
MKTEGSASGSVSQRHGSADPDPDPHQNVMDLQHGAKDSDLQLWVGRARPRAPSV